MQQHCQKKRSAILLFASITLLLMALGFGPILLVTPVSAQQTSSSDSGGQSQPSASTPRGKKLVLKDGSFQLIGNYEIQGDRIRYYSLTQHDWEEMPVALVDWDATKKEEAKEASQDAKLLEKADEQEHARQSEMTLDIDASLEILPKVFLPPGDGLFILDSKHIYSLKQAEPDEKTNKKRTIERVLVPMPMIASRKGVLLAGAHSEFRISNTEPEFYFRTSDSGQPDLALIRTKVQKDARLVENVDTTFFDQKQVRSTLPMQLWQVATGVYRFTLNQTLDPGEYAIVQAIPEVDYGTNKPAFNLVVWDFGVDSPDSTTSNEK